MQKILVVGLGNPGEEYNGTPHNAGLAVIDKLAEKITSNKDEKGFAEVWRTKVNKNEVMFVKPLLYMNKSGAALQKFLATYNLKPNTYNLVIVHDDADLPMGSIRLSYNSGSAGHKGVEDIIRALKTKEFYRFRIGTMPTVKRPRKRPKTVMNKLVTKKLMGADKRKMEKTVNLCAQLIQDTVTGGVIDTGRRNYVV